MVEKLLGAFLLLTGILFLTNSMTLIAAWILEALGAAPVQVALPELAPMLSKGTVTGSLLTYEIAPAVKMLGYAIPARVW